MSNPLQPPKPSPKHRTFHLWPHHCAVCDCPVMPDHSICLLCADDVIRFHGLLATSVSQQRQEGADSGE